MIMRKLRNAACRFWRDESGTQVIPFALWMPVFIGLIVSGMELSVLTARHTSLERALDMTVRDVRLGTGTDYTHDTLKQAVCARARALPDCENTLQLEMITLDMRNWANPPSQVQCVDTADAVDPVVTFEYGRDNQLMFLRACYKFKPIAPTTALSEALVKDANGYSAIVSMSAFVQEPS